MKTRNLFKLVVLFGLLMMLLYPAGGISASPKASTALEVLQPASLTTTKGSVIGAVSRLWVKDQSGAADNPLKYVLFQTPGKVYQGYRTYNIPATVSPGDVTNIKIVANYKGPAKAIQTWNWSLYDWTQSKWVKVGDNTGAVANTWKTLQFNVTANTKRFVNNATRQIRLQLSSNNDSNDAKLDYEAITITYQECADVLGCVTIGPNEPIHIAYLLATEGGSASLGIDERNGASIAIDDAGGKILNHNIKFDGLNSGCDPTTALAAGNKLAIDASIVGVIGTSCSGEARAAMPALSQAGFSMISPSNTAPDLTEAGDPNNHLGYLRVSWSDKIQGGRAAQYARNVLGLASAATIRDGSAYPEWLEQVFVDEFESLGGTITNRETIDPNTIYMTDALNAIKVGNPDMIYLPIFMDAGGYVVDQAKYTTGIADLYLMGSDALFTSDLIKVAGHDIDGFLVTGMDLSGFDPAYTSTFLPAYVAKYGYDPISTFHAQAYDAFNMLKAAIEGVAVVSLDGTIQIGRQALRDALYGTTNFAGLTGALTCTATGDCADVDVMAVFEYSFGDYPPVKVWP